MVQAQELLANITLLEVAVLKLEEQSSALQSEVGQARTEREIAELRLSSSESGHFKFGASNLHVSSSDPNDSLRNKHTIPLPGAETESDDIQLKVVANPTFSEATDQQPSPTVGQESERGQKPQKSWKVRFTKQSYSWLPVNTDSDFGQFYTRVRAQSLGSENNLLDSN